MKARLKSCSLDRRIQTSSETTHGREERIQTFQRQQLEKRKLRRCRPLEAKVTSWCSKQESFQSSCSLTGPLHQQHSLCQLLRSKSYVLVSFTAVCSCLVMLLDSDFIGCSLHQAIDDNLIWKLLSLVPRLIAEIEEATYCVIFISTSE